MVRLLHRERHTFKEATVIPIKVQYDASDRIFKLIDEDSATLLEGDGLYDLAIPRMFEEAGEAELN
jgi:hypothetical protein